MEQTNYKDKAEEIARESLTLEKRNPWATHTLSEASLHCLDLYSHMTSCAGHVIEEARPAEVGVELLTRTRDDWLDSLIGSHINWHLALNYLRELYSARHVWLSAVLKYARALNFTRTRFY